ncbi:MAG: tetratricopeptide repeat protein [Candidatus Omnitrophica bacterium]|nr:tetratricopeptide repeat protein [Candidatus Omnitrophota bacterium]
MKVFLQGLFIIVFFFSSVGWFWQASAARKNKEGTKLYNEQRIDEALSKWRDAQIDSPDKKELHYNIGNALHEQEKYEEAFKEYEKSLDTKDAELQAKTYYNIGNTHYRMGKLPEAIEDYEKTLEIDPDDEDAKYNIEFIKKKLQEKQEKQQTGEQDKKDEEKESEEAKEQQAQAKGSEEEEKESEEKEASAEERQEGEDKEERETGEETSPEQKTSGERRAASGEKEMSEEDAIRLLDAFKDDEKNLQKQLRMLPEGRYRVEKDW